MNHLGDEPLPLTHIRIITRIISITKKEFQMQGSHSALLMPKFLRSSTVFRFLSIFSFASFVMSSRPSSTFSMGFVSNMPAAIVLDKMSFPTLVRMKIVDQPPGLPTEPVEMSARLETSSRQTWQLGCSYLWVTFSGRVAMFLHWV